MKIVKMILKIIHISPQVKTTIFFFLSRLLVGAPNAESGQPGVDKGGAVYKCQPEHPGSCDLIPFDTKGNI